MTERRAIPGPTPDAIAALMGKVDTSSGLCWRWRASYRDDKGTIRLGGAVYRVQRVAYAWLVGPLDPNSDVRARCEVVGCVSPQHLEVITQQATGSRGYWLGMAARDALVRRCRNEWEERRKNLPRGC